MNEDLKTIHTVRHLLDESLDSCSPLVRARLDFAIAKSLQVHADALRKTQSVSRKRHAPRDPMSWLGNWFNKPSLSFAVSAVFVAFAVFGIVQTGQEYHEAKLTEMAELDAAILVDDLPPAAYVDGGFVGYTSQGVDQNLLQTDEQINDWLDSIPVQDESAT